MEKRGTHDDEESIVNGLNRYLKYFSYTTTRLPLLNHLQLHRDPERCRGRGEEGRLRGGRVRLRRGARGPPPAQDRQGRRHSGDF